MEEVLDAENNEQEAPDDEESEHEIDLVETRSSNTDTDQEISDGDTENETDIGSNELFYTGKDLVSKWKKHVPNGNRRVLQRNILRQRLSGVSAVTNNLKSPIELISYFLNEHMISLIVQYTNQHF